LLNLPFVEHDLTTDRGPVRVVVEEGLYTDYNHLPACAFVIGKPVDGCLVRVHSRCLYGDVMGSRECDCAVQLQTSLDKMWAERAGVLVYLDQEGRGSGLFAKALACRAQQEHAVDTFAVYEGNGYPEDHRNYDASARILRRLGLGSVRLLTNNPDKVAELTRHGVDVERVPLVGDFAPEAVPYIESKRARGHLFDEVRVPA
jgi:3,4-dihydroxy 2-butanone 4-phosphate synthase/GTP cyclohydrolase II